MRATRRSALKARTQAANHMKALLVSAPEELRAELCELSTSKLVKRAARFRLGGCPDDVTAATKFALRSVARRYLRLSEEVSELGEQLDRLVGEAAPELIAAHLEEYRALLECERQRQHDAEAESGGGPDAA